MKKLLFVLLPLFILPMAHGQSSSADDGLKIYRIDASAGLYTSKDIFTSIQYDNNSPWGRHSNATYFITTSFYKKKKLEVGIGLGYQEAYITNSNFGNPSIGLAPAGVVDVSYYTLLPQVRFNWIQSSDEFFEMYSIVGFALTFVDENNIQTAGEDSFYPIPGVHITGLGLRFGKTVGGFMEIGFGSKGVMSAGVSVRL